ncbi:MAG: hypothetical protein Q8908_03585 [Bacteroidota bacterium]|nr:hypothetical protein [Bacteroidota bacterium]
MRPFVSRFTFLLGLLLVLTGVALNLEAKTTLASVLVLTGLVVTLVSLYFLRRKTKVETVEDYPEPAPEDFEEDDQDDIYPAEEQRKK